MHMLRKNHIIDPIQDELEDPTKTLDTINNFLSDFGVLSNLSLKEKINYLSSPDALMNLSLNLTSCLYWLYQNNLVHDSPQIISFKNDLRSVIFLAFVDVLGLRSPTLDSVVGEWFDLAKIEICLQLEVLMGETQPEEVWSSLREYYSGTTKPDVRINTWQTQRMMN